MRKALQHLQSVDPHLGALIERVGPCRLDWGNRRKEKKHRSPYEALAESIAYQQLSGRAAATIWSRVLELYGGKRLGAPSLVQGTSTARLRAAGLSASKVIALKDLARKSQERIVPSWRTLEAMSDEEIIDRLTEVRGIGPWTVQMILIFEMGRLDVLPATDYGVQKGFQRTYRKRNLPTPAQLLRAGECWRPYRSIASWYLWRALD